MQENLNEITIIIKIIIIFIEYSTIILLKLRYILQFFCLFRRNRHKWHILLLKSTIIGVIIKMQSISEKM